jgi:mannose PTS system EIIA component
MTESTSTKGPRIGIVVAAHAPLASALVDAAAHVLGEQAMATIAAVDIKPATDGLSPLDELSRAVVRVDDGRGTLVLADLFGGSAANIALAQLHAHHVEVVTGVNLAMLLEASDGALSTATVAALAQHVADVARASVVVASGLLRVVDQDELRRAVA